MPWKPWTRERLTSVELQDYIQDQVVATFPDDAGRQAQLTTPKPGQITYLDDTKKFQVRQQDAWQPAQIYASGTYMQPAAFATSITDSDAEVGVMSILVPAQVYGAYMMRVSAVVQPAATVNVECVFRLRMDNLTGAIISKDLRRAGAFPAGLPLALTFPPWEVGPRTGASTILMTGRRGNANSGTWAIAATEQLITVEVRPAA